MLQLPLALDSKISGSTPNSFTSIVSFERIAVTLLLESPTNEALFNLNLRSLFCSAVHVEAFCDVKNTPLNGCLLIL